MHLNQRIIENQKFNIELNEKKKYIPQSSKPKNQLNVADNSPFH